jgi:uncharacterized protein YukE
MEQNALSSLAKKTAAGTQDLGGLVKQLASAAEPLKGKMDGAGKQMFDDFKARVDQIAMDLNAGMGSIAEGQAAMHTSFSEGDTQMADDARSNLAAAPIDSAKFRRA